ncbi:hypothetical protein IscW_ISCW011245 [Ixodes scapularis]|uniref:Uncharacterized protein n=1 Tax=Ixodes scapularis TaxID=6945 RepID=B7Q7F5_IXOSC|nr:hypothetical protein IscW_ISCW011245 [Ixodes scapularis]|eukprot:XP_002412158.1 hypothetical protein IscW_ISCW011245 [Ixodes scapularis]
MKQGKRHGQRAAAWRVLERLLRLLVDQPDQAKEAANLIPALMEKICVEVSAQDREVGGLFWRGPPSCSASRELPSTNWCQKNYPLDAE